MKRKLFVLGALAILVLALPSVAFAVDVNISTSAQLMDAIDNQQAGDTWIIADGTYDIDRNYTVTAGGQTGWYFPITVDDLTIHGQSRDGVIITSTEYSANGVWSTQDFIAVFGDRTIIENLTIQSKLDANKAIEVMGQDFILRQVTIANVPGNTEAHSGSLYFNGSLNGHDVGTVLIDDVLIENAHISARPQSSGVSWYVDSGTITLTDVTLDARDWAYAEYGWSLTSDNDPVFNVPTDSDMIIYLGENYADRDAVQNGPVVKAPPRAELILPEGSYGGDLSYFDTSGGEIIRYGSPAENPPTGDASISWEIIFAGITLTAVYILLIKRKASQEA